MKVAKWVVLGVSIFIFLLGYMSLESKPERMYATKPYGRGVVKETNPVGKGLKTVGVIGIGIGCLMIWADSETNERR